MIRYYCKVKYFVIYFDLSSFFSTANVPKVKLCPCVFLSNKTKFSVCSFYIPLPKFSHWKDWYLVYVTISPCKILQHYAVSIPPTPSNNHPEDLSNAMSETAKQPDYHADHPSNCPGKNILATGNNGNVWQHAWCTGKHCSGFLLKTTQATKK